VVRCGAVEVVAGREAPFGQLARLVDVAVGRRAHRQRDDPFARRCARGRIPDCRADGLDRGAVGDRHARVRAQAEAVHVRMRVEEAGHHAAAGEVDHAGVGRAQREDGGVVADREDAVARDRDRRRGPVGRIEGMDRAAVQDERRGGAGGG
jgi:hypothetical protein